MFQNATKATSAAASRNSGTPEWTPGTNTAA
jgi:hypothetical protein